MFTTNTQNDLYTRNSSRQTLPPSDEPAIDFYQNKKVNLNRNQNFQPMSLVKKKRVMPIEASVSSLLRTKLRQKPGILLSFDS